jgi:hypothetical protein
VETRDALLCNIYGGETRVKDNTREYMQATGSVKRSSKMYIEFEGGHFEHLL